MSDAVVWLNGEVVPESAARISPRDHGLLVGDGVFESVRITAGQAFALGRHLARLGRSAEALGLNLPAVAELRTAVTDVLAATGITEGRLRITATSGPGGFLLGSAGRSGHRRRGRRGGTAVVTPRRGRDSAVASQRAGRRRRREDHLLRRERGGAAAGARRWGRRGDLRQHPRRFVRGDGYKRLPRPRRANS